MASTSRVLKTRAKALRANPTPSEKKFRQRLLDASIKHSFQLVVGFYIVDFMIRESLLIVEIDGKIHDSQIDYDITRTKWLEKFGFEVLRIKNEDVASFDLTAITLRPKRIGYTSSLHKANNERNGVLHGQRRKKEEREVDILVRKTPEKSGFIRESGVKVNAKKAMWERDSAYQRRTIKVIKGDDVKMALLKEALEKRKNKFTSTTSRKQRKADREWIRGRNHPVSLDEAAKLLNDDTVYRKAMKGLPDD